MVDKVASGFEGSDVQRSLIFSFYGHVKGKKKVTVITSGDRTLLYIQRDGVDLFSSLMLDSDATDHMVSNKWYNL